MVVIGAFMQYNVCVEYTQTVLCDRKLKRERQTWYTRRVQVGSETHYFSRLPLLTIIVPNPFFVYANIPKFQIGKYNKYFKNELFKI